MGVQVDQLMQLLHTSMAESLRVLAVLSEVELDEACEHVCAMGGVVRDLLTHNIDHERMHVGQVYSARYSLRKMQKNEVDRLMVETLRARTDLIAALIGLPDDALDARTPADEWTIREIVEHTVYWERHSLDDLAQTRLAGRVQPNPDLALDVADPIAGPLHGPANHAQPAFNPGAP